MLSTTVKLGDQVVIKTELIKVSDGSQIWGDEYKSNVADILSVQDEVSRKISESLRVRLTGEDEEKPASDTAVTRGLPTLSEAATTGTNATKGNSIDYFKRAENEIHHSR